MRWPHEEHKTGDKRTIKKFLVLPRTAYKKDGTLETRWLEKAEFTQIYQNVRVATKSGPINKKMWLNDEWIDE